MKRLWNGLKNIIFSPFVYRMYVRFQLFLKALRIACYSVLFGLATYLIAPYHSVEPVLRPDYDMFMIMAKATCRDDQLFLPKKTIVRFGDLSQQKDEWGNKGRVIGLCERDYPKMWRLTFNRYWWFTASDAERSALIYHEMTHCLLLKDHVYGNPADYMSPVIPTVDRFGLYKQVLDTLTATCRR